MGLIIAKNIPVKPYHFSRGYLCETRPEPPPLPPVGRNRGKRRKSGLFGHWIWQRDPCAMVRGPRAGTSIAGTSIAGMASAGHRYRIRAPRTTDQRHRFQQARGRRRAARLTGEHGAGKKTPRRLAGVVLDARGWRYAASNSRGALAILLYTTVERRWMSP